VLTDGHVGRVELARSSGFDDLDQAAVKAARDWRFEPATDGSRAIVSWTDVRYRYVLE
jgi:protein TonB